MSVHEEMVGRGYSVRKQSSNILTDEYSPNTFGGDEYSNKTIEAMVFKDIRGYFIKAKERTFLGNKRLVCRHLHFSSDYIASVIKYVSNMSDYEKAADILVLAVYEYLCSSNCDNNLASVDVLEFQLSYIFDTTLGTMNPETIKGSHITDARRILNSISKKMFKIDHNNILHINIDCLCNKTREFTDLRALLFSGLVTVD